MKTEVKDTFDRLKLKYGYLWDQLKNDSSVIQEFESIKKASADAVRVETKRQPLSNVTNKTDESFLDHTKGINDPTCGGNSDSEFIDEIAKSEIQKPATPEHTATAELREQPTNTAQDFLSAILNKETKNIRIPTNRNNCCDLLDCEGCAEPILEIDDKDHASSSSDEFEGEGIRTVKQVAADDIQVSETQQEHQSKILSRARFETVNRDSYSGDDDSSLDSSTSNGGNDDDNQSCSGSSSSGSTVLHFDLSHLNIGSGDDEAATSIGNEEDGRRHGDNKDYTENEDNHQSGDFQVDLDLEMNVEALSSTFQNVSIIFDREREDGPEKITTSQSKEGKSFDNYDDEDDDSKATSAQQSIEHERDNSVVEHGSSGSSSGSSTDIVLELGDTTFVSAGIDIGGEGNQDGDDDTLTETSSKNDSAVEAIEASWIDSDESSATNMEFAFDQSTFVEAGIDIDYTDDDVEDDVPEEDQRDEATESGELSEEVDAALNSTDKSMDDSGLDDNSARKNFEANSADKDNSIKSNLQGTGINVMKKLSFGSDTAEKNLQAKTHVNNDKAEMDDDYSSDEAEWSENDAGFDDDGSSITDANNTKNEVIIVDDSDEISYEESFNRFDLESSIEAVDDTFDDLDKKVRKSNRTESRVTFILDDSDEVSCNSSEEQGRRIETKKTPQKKTPMKKKTPNFKKNRDILTRQAFGEFNKQVFKGALGAVEVQWSTRLTSTAGLTRLKRRGKGSTEMRSATIELSTKLIDDNERLRSTLMHEMCHAAAWLVDNVHKPPHGTCFKKWAALGMRKVRVGVRYYICLMQISFLLFLISQFFSSIL